MNEDECEQCGPYEVYEITVTARGCDRYSALRQAIRALEDESGVSPTHQHNVKVRRIT